MTRKLHIGGHVKTSGWEVFDANPGPTVDHVGDARDLNCFSDATFAEIYASHVLEHFDYQGDLSAALSEWLRVLVPGGSLYISVPDLDVLARLFIDRELLTPQERFMVMRMIFGGHIDKHDYHYVGLNEEFLKHFLAVAGFVNYVRVARFSIFDDSSNQQMRGVPISLNMIARKP